MRRLLAAVCVTLLTSGLLQADPPPTPVEVVSEMVHGVELMDPYRWLEGDNSDPANMGAMSSRVDEWTTTQNAYTREVLDALPGRAELESRLRELMEIGSVSAPTMRKNRYFFRKREGNQSQAVVYVREGSDGESRVLLDPNTVDASGLVTVSWTVPNQQGTLMAFGMYSKGDENATLYILNVDTGEWLADEIPGKVGGVAWLPDSTGFFYRRLADLSNPYSAEVRFHTVGTHWRQDPILFTQQNVEGIYADSGREFTQDELDALRTTYGPWADVSDDGRWMLIGYYSGTRNIDLWVADVDKWFRTGKFTKTPIIVGEDAKSYGPIVGDTLFMSTNLNAPNGRIIAVDLNNPSPDRWREIVPAREDAVVEEIAASRGLLTIQYLQNASTRIALHGFDGSPLGDVDLPGIGSASLSTSPDRTEAFLSFESFNEPDSIYRVDLRSGDRWLWERPDVPVDPTQVEVTQKWYPSKDGTKVSMFVIHRKGLDLENKTYPTILYGYGGFDISMTPRFSATLFPWFEADGVYCVANLRGGGEYGKAWHDAGRLDRKQNVFDDCIAAAEWLIKEGYTTPEQLAVAGGSNGGLLVGAVVTQRPDLFKAAICGVPLLDMVRYQQFLMARYWVPEYGSSERADQFRTLLAYSPYHNVKQGVEYPAMLITAGENDSRVHPLHARKMAALLQASTASSPTDRPILLWVDREAGHGAGKPLHLRIRDIADQRAFLMWQLGSK